MSVKIELNTVEVKGALNDAVIAALYEAAEELTSITKRNTRPVRKGRHNVKDSWQYKVDENKKTATVGSQLEASYWEELGTGSHALNKDGRKGWWVYVEGNDTPRPFQQTYTKEEAEAIAASMRKKGLDAHATDGMEPNRPLFRSFEANRQWVKDLIAQKLEESMK